MQKLRPHRAALIASLLLLIISPAVVPAQKNQTPEERQEFFKKEIAKARWVFLGRDEDRTPYYVDANTMSRTLSVVIFAVKSVKRRTIEYDKMLGGCTKDILATSIVMMANPGTKGFLGHEIENPEMEVVPKGSLGYQLLDYVCAHAKVVDLGISN